MERQRLVLFASGRILTAVVLRVTLRGCEVRAIRYAGLEVGELDPDRLTRALAVLRRACADDGCEAAWSGTVLVVLPSSAVLFRELELPGTSLRVARKSLDLLLEGEFPDTQSLREATFFVREKQGGNVGFRALTLLVPESIAALWQDALREQGFTACRFTANPWPILAGIPKKTGSALLLHMQDGEASLALLSKEGKPVRIRSLGRQTLPDEQSAKREDYERIAKQLYIAASLVLEGMASRPASLLVYGDLTTQQDALVALSTIFALPVKVPGADFPLFGRNARLEETETHRLAAESLFKACMTYGVRPSALPLFSSTLQKTSWTAASLRLYLPLAAGFALLFTGIGTTCVVQSLNQVEQTERLRASLQDDLRRALPDAPKNAGASRLRSILKSKLKELEAHRSLGQDYACVRFLEQLHALTPTTVRVDIVRLSLNVEQCRLQGTAASFDDINSMREILSQMEGISSVRVVSATNRMDDRDSSRKKGAGRVDFELVLTRGNS